MLEYSILNSENGIKYKPYLFIKNSSYGALGDDFSNLDGSTLKTLLLSILDVVNGNKKQDDIYGYICYRISMTKTISEIFCYDEYLGKETTSEIFNMLHDLTNHIELFEKQNKNT